MLRTGGKEKVNATYSKRLINPTNRIQNVSLMTGDLTTILKLQKVKALNYI